MRRSNGISKNSGTAGSGGYCAVNLILMAKDEDDGDKGSRLYMGRWALLSSLDFVIHDATEIYNKDDRLQKKAIRLQQSR